MRNHIKITLFFLLIVTVISACAKKATATPTSNAAIPNPASVNCLDKGGKLEIQERADLGQIGICVFDNNRQCDEWALWRGECPVGGVDISGYATQAAVFCVISGGEYAVTGNNGAVDEQGTCTFKNNKSCDAWDYYNGKCSPNE